MFKKILVPLDGSPNSQSAVRYALWLGKHLKASLIGVHVVDVVALEGPLLHDLSGSLGFEPYLNFSTRMREILESKGKEILSSFEEECKKAAIPCETFLDFGIVTNEVVERARLSDLVIIGRRGVNYAFDDGLLGSVTEGVIRRSPRPVMVVPQNFIEVKSPLLLYDGSPNASKVMRSAVEICKLLGLGLKAITVSKAEGEGRKRLAEVEDYARPYGIDLQTEEVIGNPPEDIVYYCEERDHDLVFMGVTSHSRIVEMVLGSTTEFVMRRLNIPIFLER